MFKWWIFHCHVLFFGGILPLTAPPSFEDEHFLSVDSFFATFSCGSHALFFSSRHSLKLTASSPLKVDLNTPKANLIFQHLPTSHFQVQFVGFKIYQIIPQRFPLDSQSGHFPEIRREVSGRFIPIITMYGFIPSFSTKGPTNPTKGHPVIL